MTEQLTEARSKVDAGQRRMNFKFIPETRGGDLNELSFRLKTSPSPLTTERSLINTTRHEGQRILRRRSNGCGKSTLIRVLTGHDDDFSGDIRLSETITYAYMGQYVNFKDESRTVYDELYRRSQLKQTDMRNLLARFGFRGDDVFKEINVLSGGERSRLYLCCLLEERPDLLFLDEPTNHLDIHSMEILERALADYEGAILAISHDRYFIDALANRIAGFLGSQIQFFDRFDDYRVAAKNYELEQKSAVQAVRAAEQENHSTKRNAQRVNRAEERRLQAKLKRDIRKYEEEITTLESEIEKIEGTIGPETNPQTYEQLADLSARLEDYCETYFALLEKQEAEDVSE